MYKHIDTKAERMSKLELVLKTMTKESVPEPHLDTRINQDKSGTGNEDLSFGSKRMDTSEISVLKKQSN